jgi:hypothetical protein
LVLSTATRIARADGAEAEPFRLTFSTSANCGVAEAFLAELRARTARLRAAKEAEHGITFVVETFRVPGGVRGQLVMHRPGALPIVREVPGATCGEVISAMALIAALMVDPLAGASPVNPTSPTAGHEQEHPESRGTPFAFRVDHRLTTRNAVAPKFALGQALVISVTHETGPLRPSLGLSLSTARASTTVTSGAAQFDWIAARLTPCPVGLGSARSWDLRLCAGLELGRLRGKGYATVAPATQSIVWSSAAALLDAHRRLLGPLWLGGEAGLTFPFTREHFYLEPHTNLHRIPAWGVSAGVGLGLDFF